MFLTDQATEPWEDSFIPSMKSQNEIFWMVHWWVLGHSSLLSSINLNSNLGLLLTPIHVAITPSPLPLSFPPGSHKSKGDWIKVSVYIKVYSGRLCHFLDHTIAHKAWGDDHTLIIVTKIFIEYEVFFL